MSVIKVNKIENTGTTAGGVEVDSSGHVQVGGLQMPTAGVLSNRNYVINGSFQVWQRGTSFTANSAVTFGADRFAAYGASSAANAYTRSTDVPANQGFTYSGSFDSVDIRHAIELPGDALRGPFVNGSKWTLSFWIKGGSTGTSSVNVGWSNGASSSQLTYWGTAASFTYSTNWEKKELTFTVANNLVSGDKAVLLYFSAFSGQKITGIQFEQGEKATPFEHRSYGDELARCQRYYETGGPYETSATASGAIGRTNIHFHVAKRADATVVIAVTADETGTLLQDHTSGFCYQTSGSAVGDETEFTFTAEAEL